MESPGNWSGAQWLKTASKQWLWKRKLNPEVQSDSLRTSVELKPILIAWRLGAKVVGSNPATPTLKKKRDISIKWGNPFFMCTKCAQKQPWFLLKASTMASSLLISSLVGSSTLLAWTGSAGGFDCSNSSMGTIWNGLPVFRLIISRAVANC